MILSYKNDSKQLISQLRFFFLPLLFAVFLALFVKDTRLLIGVFFIFTIIAAPQIYLIFQYEKVSKHKAININIEKRTIEIINSSNQVISKEFSDIKNIEHYYVNARKVLNSFVLLLCAHFYYYRFEFSDGSVLFMTSLMSPKIQFSDKGIFYDFLIKREVRYPYIKHP